jgi:hypothetical protein
MIRVSKNKKALKCGKRNEDESIYGNLDEKELKFEKEKPPSDNNNCR